MERLSALSYAFLAAEDVDPGASLVIGSVAVLDGPAPSVEELRTHVRERLDLAPRYRERVHRTALDLTAPRWVPDPSFDIDHHVTAAPVPGEGDDQDLAEVVGSVMSRRMDPHRALWDCHLVDGLDGGRWALIARVHHALADGLSGTALLRVLYDLDSDGDVHSGGGGVERAPAAPAVPASHTPVSRSPVALASAVVRGSLALAGALRPVRSTFLTGPLGAGRSYAWSQVSLSAGRAAAHAHGVSLNDVVLACVAGGFRELLLDAGLQPDRHALRTLVPVSSRAPGSEEHPDNRVTLLLPELPVDVSDPFERLAVVHARVAALRREHEPEMGDLVQAVAGVLPFAVVAGAERLGLGLPQRQVATVATNVPGPREALSCLGRPVLDLLPYVPLADRVRVGVAVLSYRDVMSFGVTGDAASAIDIDGLARRIAGAWTTLCLGKPIAR
ncbi:wax ester/triacylglycerol synthase family O-acyltransferase [soil metagenome]